MPVPWHQLHLRQAAANLPMNKELLMEDCICEPCEAGGSYDVNMEPDDIEVSDTVTVSWEIG